MNDPSGPPSPPSPASPSGAWLRHPLVIAALALAGLVVIGAFLPWASVLNLDVTGVEADGKLTLILALVGAAALLLGRGRKWGLITMTIAAALVTLIGFVDLDDVQGVADQIGLVETGSGLWITALAGLAWLVVAIALLAKRGTVWAAHEPAPDAAAGETAE